MRATKSHRQHRTDHSHRATVEVLDPRRLLSAAVVDPATELLRQRIWDAAGVSAEDANAILGERQVEADAAAGVELTDVAYLSPLSRTAASALSPTIQAVRFESFSIDAGRLAGVLRTAPHERAGAVTRAELPTLLLPTPDGGVARFGMQSYDLLAPAVARQMPDIQSIRLYGLDDAAAVGTATLTTLGLSAFISSPHGDWYVNPIELNRGGAAHASYFHSHQFSKPDPAGGHGGGCMCPACVAEVNASVSATLGGNPNPDALIDTGAARKTYRIVIGATGEYSQQFGPGTPQVIQNAAFASITSFISQANTIYGRDMNIAFQIVSDLRTVYLDTFTDGYTNGNVGTLSDENVTKMNAIYSDNTFDIGHVFSTGTDNGVATTLSTGGSIGQTFKASAASSGMLSNNAEFIRTVLHEMGHQTGASHTYNVADPGGRAADSAYEPGPGSTLMSYGGNALSYGGNFVTYVDLYFHHRSIDQSENYLTTNALAIAAGTETLTGNIAPVVNAGLNRTIPAATPFELTGQAYDFQGGALTYTWEQYDLGDADPIGTDDGEGPLLRSREGALSPTRMFPELADVLVNSTQLEEPFPQVARTVDPLTFRLTVKDQLGGVSDDVVDVAVVNTGAAFAITSQNSAGTTWAAGSSQTVTWNVAGTTGNGINTSNVDVFISYDAGVTFTPVALSFPNNGSGTFNVPLHAPNSTTARIKVKGRDNYFFDINNANITITGTAPLNGLPTTAPAVEASIYAGPKADIVDADFPKLGGLNPNLESVGDTDTYLFGPDATGLYTIDAADDDSGAPSNVDTVLAVYDHFTGAQIAINDDISGSNVDSRVFAFLEAGKLYRISVGDFGSNDAGEVSLTITGGPILPTTPISLNADGDGSINGNLVSGRTAKFHTFTTPSLFDGSGTINFSAPNSTLVATIYDSSDVLRAYSINGTFSGSQISGLVAGATYTLRIGAKDFAIGGGDYTVNVNLGIDAPLPATLSVADGTIAFHGPTQDSYDAHSPDIFIVSPDEVDARYLAPTSGALSRTGDIEVIGGSLNPTVAIYNATTGARLALANGTGVGSTALIDNFSFQPDTRYILAVSGLGNTTGNPNVRVLMDSVPFPSPNVTLDSAGDGFAAFNFPSTSIGQSFRIVAPANASGFVTFEADPDAASDVELYLFNSAGDELAVSQAAGPNASETLAQLFVPPGTEFFATVIAQNYAGGSTAATGTFRVNFDTPLVTPPAPPAPELLPADDTGVSNSDRITFKNTNLGIVVNAPTGQFIRLFRDGVQVAGPAAVGVTTFLTLNDPAALADGTYNYTATAAATSSSAQSPASAPVLVTIDTNAPQPDGFSFRFDDGPQDHLFFVDYNQELFDFVPSDITVRNLTTNQTLPSASFNLSVGGSGLNDLFYNPTAGNDRLPSGNYEISIAAGAATDVAGNPIGARIENFFFLDADANRDRQVNINDFAILASRFNLSGTFSQGDFDYNGVANISDFALLASRFNTSLPAPANLPRQSGESLRPERMVFSQRVIDEEEQLADLVR